MELPSERINDAELEEQRICDDLLGLHSLHGTTLNVTDASSTDMHILTDANSPDSGMDEEETRHSLGTAQNTQTTSIGGTQPQPK
ncbi:hypothetical protein HGRIS_014005 [Hohenbuehelia grisea]|uniref:Uncharacterized protein n=1 Tax=Hohenbuehelia grisea TaxID=104357 RepID=A0ABR3JTQ7_9AGAR